MATKINKDFEHLYDELTVLKEHINTIKESQDKYMDLLLTKANELQTYAHALEEETKKPKKGFLGWLFR